MFFFEIWKKRKIRVLEHCLGPQAWQLPQRSAASQPLVERNRCCYWSSSPSALRKNRSRFYLLADRAKLQAPSRRLRLREKSTARNTFCCVKTLTLHCVTEWWKTRIITCFGRYGWNDCNKIINIIIIITTFHHPGVHRVGRLFEYASKKQESL